MSFSVIPLVGLFLFLVQLAYPLWQTSRLVVGKPRKALDEDPREAELNYIQWTTYWMIYVLYSWLESSLLIFVVPYWPLYGEMKLCFFAWLTLPNFRGALWTWMVLLKDNFKAIDETLTDFVETRLQTVYAYALGPGPGDAAGSMTKEKKFISSRVACAAMTTTNTASTDTTSDVAVTL